MDGKKGEIGVKAYSFYSGESLETLRNRLGSAEYRRRLLLCQDRALAAAGYYRKGIKPEDIVLASEQADAE